MSKELKEIMKMISHQIESINRDKNYSFNKKKQVEILELKSTMIKMKNSLEGLHSRFKLPEESANLERDQFSNLNNRRMNKNEFSLRSVGYHQAY